MYKIYGGRILRLPPNGHANVPLRGAFAISVTAVIADHAACQAIGDTIAVERFVVVDATTQHVIYQLLNRADL